jgi:serine/threonine protein kinase
MLQAEQVVNERYQLKQLLGNNPNRQTWLALDLETHPSQQVIVKLLPFSPQTQWDDIKLFEREAQVLKHLNHLRIPEYRDYFSIEKDTDNDLPSFGLVQDYIQGLSLQHLLKNGKKFSEKEAKGIAIQLLYILIYLHELSPPVLHRDIKPSNIILSENQQVYLVDFGAVQEKARAEGVTFTVVGTGGYAPPEQLWGRAVPGSDLYALGATLIHLLTGISPTHLSQHRMRLQFQDKVSLTSEFAQWIERLTEPAPERRFKEARQALAALESSTKNRKITVPKARYGRIGGLALLQYSAVMLFAVAIPSFVVYRDVCKQCEGRSNIRTINRAQQAYFLEHSQFSNSLQDLGLGTTNEPEKYKYSIRSTPLAAYNYATPGDTTIKGYVGSVFLTPANDGTDELLTLTFICEAKSPSLIRPDAPIVRGNILECGNDTKFLGSADDQETGRTILGKDSALAYNSLNYAADGNYNQALLVAEAIESKALKEKTLNAITHQFPGRLPNKSVAQNLTQALAIAKRIKDDDIKAWVFADIAYKYAAQGQHSQALQILSQALEIANTLEDADTKAMVWNDIAYKYGLADKKFLEKP